MTRVLQVVGRNPRLRAALDRLTAVESTVIRSGAPWWLAASQARIVHAHEGALADGARLASRLGVPLVVTLGPGATDVPPGAALVLAGDHDAVAHLGSRPDLRERVRCAPDERIGVAADLEGWYHDLVAGRDLGTDLASDPSPSVTVVMSTYQRADLLARALGALADQTYPDARFDLVVVDNGSTDHTAQVLDDAKRTLGPRLTVLRNERNTSAAAARNRALVAAGGEIVAFTDDDCRPTPTWLETLVGSFRDDVGLVQGRTRPDPVQRLGPTSRSQWTSREHGLYETCNLAYRRSVLERLGPAPFAIDMSARLSALLGERIGAMAFGEDVDLAWRVKRDGARSRFASDAVVHHHVFDSDTGYLLRRSLQAAGFPMLTKDFPELRDSFLFHRYFLSRRHLLLLVGMVGTLSPSPVTRGAAWLPYGVELVGFRRPGRRRRLRGAPLRVVRDIVETAALSYGSVRARSAVL